MRRFALLLSCLALLSGSACGATVAAVVSPPPAALGLDPFYAKYLDADGIPVVASVGVPDRALVVAREIVVGLLRHRPDLGHVLVAWHQRVAIMAPDEGTVDLPEQRDWKKPTITDIRLTVCERKHYTDRIGRLSDRDYWNGRARGMAGLLTSGAAEDLLGLRSSRYYGETIFLHEFSHQVLAAIRVADPALSARVDTAYRAALAAGKWKGEYAAVNVDEYWAEGTQFWFNSNKVAVMDGRRVLSDDDLRAYDPGLYAVLRATYGDRHHIDGDPFYDSPARVPPGPLPHNTAEVC